MEKTAHFFEPFDRLATSPQSSPGRDLLAGNVYLPLHLLLSIRLFHWRRIPPRSIEVLLLLVYLMSAPVQAVFFTRVRFGLPADPLAAVIANGVVRRFLAHEERARQGTPAVQ